MKQADIRELTSDEIESVTGGARVIDGVPRSAKYIGIAATGAMAGAIFGPFGAAAGAAGAVGIAYLSGL